MLAMLAARGGVAAAAKDDPQGRRPNPRPRSQGRDQSPRPRSTRRRRPKPWREAKPEPSTADKPAAPRPPRVVQAVDAPAPIETVGFSDRLFVRRPGTRWWCSRARCVQVDGAAFPRQTPRTGVFMRRARVQLTGWLGRNLLLRRVGRLRPGAARRRRPAGASALPATDNYVSLVPAGDRLIVQAGQFDVPFTLENRTADAYTMFIERAMVARSLGAPRNKDIGVMVHGLLGNGVLYYSAGVFNGDGPNFRNFDNQPDAIGRATLSPFAAGEGAFRRLTLGIRAGTGATSGAHVPGSGDARRPALSRAGSG